MNVFKDCLKLSLQQVEDCSLSERLKGSSRPPGQPQQRPVIQTCRHCSVGPTAADKWYIKDNDNWQLQRLVASTRAMSYAADTGRHLCQGYAGLTAGCLAGAHQSISDVSVHGHRHSH